MDKLIKALIPQDRIDLAKEDAVTFEKLLSVINSENYLNEKKDTPFDGFPPDIGIIGAGDFAISFSASFKANTKILIYDVDPIKSIFSDITRISTNNSFLLKLKNNIRFTNRFEDILNSRFLLLGVPASAIPSVISKIKKTIPDTFKFKQYVLISKGFIRRGYIPHKWLEKEGVPFENIIWASGGNVAKDILLKKSFRISIVSSNRNKKYRKVFSSFFNTEFLVPEQYSGTALLACELGGILKNYYAGVGRYLFVKYGDKVLNHYKLLARSEFRKAVRKFSHAPTISLRAWIIKKASHGPSFWEDLDVTIKNGRNGFFGELILNKNSLKSTLSKLGLVESFNNIFSTLSLFHYVKNSKKLFILSGILDIYEGIHIEYLESKDAVISEEGLFILKKIEDYVLDSMRLTSQDGLIIKLKNFFNLN